MGQQPSASLAHQPSGSQTGLTSAMGDLAQSGSSTGPGDVDMQNAEASADSASSPITQQVLALGPGGCWMPPLPYSTANL